MVKFELIRGYRPHDEQARSQTGDYLCLPDSSLSFLSSKYMERKQLAVKAAEVSGPIIGHAIRITLPYDDCKDVISKWANRSQTVVVYEHPADEEISKTHVHIALGGCETKSEALKRMWKDAPGKGNEFWSWKDWDGKMEYVTYMSKGKYAPKFVKNISEDILEKSRQLWVEPVKADKSGDTSERVVKKVYSKIVSSFVYSSLSDIDRCDRIECGAETLLKLVRRETFRELWQEHKRFPHASHYKIVAGTVYMRLCEHYNCFDEGMEIISQLWL